MQMNEKKPKRLRTEIDWTITFLCFSLFILISFVVCLSILYLFCSILQFFSDACESQTGYEEKEIGISSSQIVDPAVYD